MAATEGGRKLNGLVSGPAAVAASGPASDSSPAASSPASSPTASSPPGSSNTPTSAPSWKGRRIRRFKLVDELGEGAMGKVFVAEDTVLRRHIAMKLLPSKHRDGRPNHRTERLITEARSAATLEHPSVVTIHEIDQSGGVHYIAMELIEGGNLERLVQMSGPMEVERACQLIAEAAEALAHAHSRGIVHRDVKPANLLLTRSGRCKVCDFGLAMVETPEGDPTKMRCVGTPYFISPEIAMGKGATASSDIYSLGCTLFFLLTGRPPFPGTSSRQVLKMHVNDPLPDLRRWRADVPDRLIAALSQACDKDPAKRFSDAERLAKTLRTFTITPGANLGGIAGAPAPALVPMPANLSGMSGSGMHGSNVHGGGSSGQMLPISAQTATVALPAMSHLISNAISQAGSQGMSQNFSQNISPGMSGMTQPAAPSAFMRPVVWAVVATFATAGLIALGMWLVRPGLEKAQGGNQGAAESLAVSRTAPAAIAPAQPVGEPSLFATPQAAVAPVASAVGAPIVASTTMPAATPAVASVATVNVVAGNALINGTMEDADTDDGLAGWFIHPRFKSQAQILRENGNRFLRLTNDDETKTVFVDQKIDVDPSWKAITISARMRATNFKAGKGSAHDGRVAFAFRDANGARVGSWPPVPLVRSDCAWTERTMTADVPKGAATIYVQLAIFNAIGSVDFDDVAIVPQK